MKLEIFTKAQIAKTASAMLLSTLFVFAFAGTMFSQNCPLVANDLVQVSMDDDCKVGITPDMILEAPGVPASCSYTVVVLGPNGNPLSPHPDTVTSQHVGMTLTVEVHLGDNKVSGKIKIEDNLPPVINCPTTAREAWCWQDPDTLGVDITVNEPCGTYRLDTLSNVTTDFDCSSSLSAQQIIAIQAIDESGNRSVVCRDTINYRRLTIRTQPSVTGDSIIKPINYDGLTAPDHYAALPCDNSTGWDTNGNGLPDVDEVKAPYITMANLDGKNAKDTFYLNQPNRFCEFNIKYKDDRINVCNGTFKILREWTVLDWCTGAIHKVNQVIKVIDDVAPVVTCPADTLKVDANVYKCQGTWNVVAPAMSDNCGSTKYTVTYQHADRYGNFPVANGGIYSDENVSGTQGSYKISKLPLGLTKVKFTVVDDCGNVGECFRMIEVVDNVAPYTICKEFTVTSLTNHGTARVPAESFDDGSYDNCSKVKIEVKRMTNNCNDPDWDVYKPYVDFCCEDVGKSRLMVILRATDAAGNSNTCMVEIKIEDKIAPWIQCLPDTTIRCGESLDVVRRPKHGIDYGDNCGQPELALTEDQKLSQCHVGTVTRTYTVKDKGGRTASCTQKINVVDTDPFVCEDIKWPKDASFEGCMIADVDPKYTGKPTYSDDECSHIASSYKDQVFTFSKDACYKILRTWTVIDWCTHDPNYHYTGGHTGKCKEFRKPGYWQYTQIIKVNNIVKPKFDSCEDYTVEIFGSCEGEVKFEQSATDDCTQKDKLKYRYQIDTDFDGKADRVGTGKSVTLTLAPGKYKVWWVVEDLCGNLERCEQVVTVKDGKKPTPYCLGDVTTVVMPSSMMVPVRASSFNLGSYDNCTDKDKLKYSFSQDTTDVRRVFTCTEVGENKLDIWVTDEAGNQDFCTITVNIQPNKACGKGRVSGQVMTENRMPVREVEVSLNNMSSSENHMFKTTENGVFQFTSVSNDADYTIAPKKNTNARNGVNTRDLLAIQRHLLGLEKLDSPYQLIAADANRDNKINPQDLLEIRKLILAINDEFPKNTSWRFVNSKHVFSDPKKPWGFDEYIVVNEVNASSTDESFIGIKVGDVDGSAKLSLTESKIETRSTESLKMAYDFATYRAGDLVEIPVFAGATASIAGLQYAILLDGMEVVDVQSGAMDIDAGYHVTETSFAMSWNTAMSRRFAKGEVLFTLLLRAEAAGNTNQLFAFDQTDIAAEAYTEDLEVMDVNVEVRNTPSTLDFAVAQNNPNPFLGSTVINMQLPRAGLVDVSIFTLTGKKVYQDSRMYTAGSQAITINADQFEASGVMYYQVTYGGQTITKKMISIRK